MVYTADSLGEPVASRTIDLLRHNSVMITLVNRDFEPSAANAHTVKVPVFRSQREADGRDSSNAALTGNNAVTSGTFDHDTGGEFAVAGDDGLTYEDLDIDQEIKKSWFVPQVALAQLPSEVGDPVAQASQVLGFQLSHELDQKLFTAFTTGVTAPTAATTFGDATNFVDDDGVVNGTGVSGVVAGEFIWNMLKRFNLQATKRGFGIDSPTPYARWAVMNQQCYDTLEQWLLDKNLNSAGQFNLDIVRGAFNQGALSRTERVIKGTAILISNEIPSGSASSKDHHQILFGTNRALAYASQDMITRVLDRDQNQLGDGSNTGQNKIGSLIQAWQSYGTHFIDTRQAMLAFVRAEA